MSLSVQRSPLTLNSLPSNMLLAVFNKLTAVPLTRLRRTCSRLNNFVEEHHEKLSRRVFKAPTNTEKTTLLLFISQDMEDYDECNHLCLQWHTETALWFHLEIDKPDEAKKYLTSGIPIRMITVQMPLVDRPALLRLVDFLKKWNLFSNETFFHCPAECSLNILECVQANKYSLHTGANVEQELVVLNQSAKKDQLVVTAVIMPEQGYHFLNECYGFKDVFCMSILRDDDLNHILRLLHINGLREKCSFSLSKQSFFPIMPAGLDQSLPIRTLWDVKWVSLTPGYKASTFIYKYIATLRMGDKVGILTNHLLRHDFVSVQVVELDRFEEKLFSMMRDGNVISPQFSEKDDLLHAHRVGDNETMKKMMVDEYLHNRK